MDIIIRKASVTDLDQIMNIFLLARKFMIASGNPNQWIDGYPQKYFILNEIKQEHCYVCVTVQQTIVGTFCLLQGPDSTYNKIYDGNWLNDEPYYVIHRLASSGSIKGIGNICLDWCIRKYKNLRIDTHSDNRIMQLLVERHGFLKCGIIYVANGSSRIAYQRVSP